MDATTAQFLSIVRTSCDSLELAAWFDALPQTKPNLASSLRKQIQFLNETYSHSTDTPLNLALRNTWTNDSGGDNFSIVSTCRF